MAGYSNNTPNDVYKNGTLARFNDQEWEFIRQYSSDNSANRPPTLINIQGKNDGTNPSSDKPFKYVIPNVQNGKIVGFNWRNPDLPGTTGPSDPSNPNRGSINENTTAAAISAVKNGTMDPREAMFIIRARVGMETAVVPIVPPGSNDSVLYRLDAPDNVRASYGDGKQNTSFNSSNMRGQIYNQNFARELLKAFNNFASELEKGIKDGTIKETYDINGHPRYIKRGPISGGIDNWVLFAPDISGIIQRIDQRSLQYVADDLNHLASGTAVRNQNPNDNTSRGTGPKTKLLESGITEPVGATKQTLDVVYKGIKSGVQYGVYAGVIGTFFLVGFLQAFGKVDYHTAHHALEFIEWVSVGGKTLKNLSRTTSPSYQTWWDQVSPLYSTAAPTGWYLLGGWMSNALERVVGAELAIWSGPVVTFIVIATEFAYEYWKQKKQEEAERLRLFDEGNKKGCIGRIYAESGGSVCIPIIDEREYTVPTSPQGGRGSRIKRGRIPIGVKKDKDGNVIHLKYKDIDPNSPIPNVDVPILDKNGRPIPGSWYPVLIYPSEPISMSGDSGNEPGIHNNLGFYTDADEDIVNSNISINTTKIESDDRTQKYRDISGINDSNGFGLLSNRDAIPYRPTGTGPERGGMSGDEPDFRSPLEKINDWNPWGDGNDNETPFSNNINTNPSDINPTENKNGAPSNSNQNILNGNSSVIVAGYPVG